MDAYDKSEGVVDCAPASDPGSAAGWEAASQMDAHWMEILVPSLARRRLIPGRKHALFDQRGRDERRMRGQYGGYRQAMWRSSICGCLAKERRGRVESVDTVGLNDGVNIPLGEA